MLDNLMTLSLIIIEFLQTQLTWFAPIMKFFTFFGNEEFYLLIMPLFVWSLDYGMGLRLGVMLMISNGLNFFLKTSFQQPRPYWVSTNIQNMTSPMVSFGLPSGHSQNAASVFGLLSTSVKQKWLKGILYFTILMIGISRLFLGVHSLSDILLGFLIGILLLLIFLKIEKIVVKAFNRLTIFTKILSIFGLSILLILLGVSIISVFGNTPLPTAWIQNAHIAHPQEDLLPFSMDGLISSAAVLFGLISGGIWVKERGGYEANSGSLMSHILRFLIGFAGILIIWKGLGSLFPQGADFMSLSLRYLRYALIGIWISGLAPMLFTTIKLVNKE